MVFEIICKFSAWHIQMVYFYPQGEKLLSGELHYTDKELFLLIADGDEAAFAILFLAFALTVDKDEALNSGNETLSSRMDGMAKRNQAIICSSVR